MRMFMQPVMILAMVTFGAAAFAGPAEQSAIKAGCLKSTNWSEAACQCTANKAADLAEAQQAFLAATLMQDKGAVTQALQQMSHAEMMEAAMFVTQTGPACQGG